MSGLPRKLVLVLLAQSYAGSPESIGQQGWDGRADGPITAARRVRILSWQWSPETGRLGPHLRACAAGPKLYGTREPVLGQGDRMADVLAHAAHEVRSYRAVRSSARGFGDRSKAGPQARESGGGYGSDLLGKPSLDGAGLAVGGADARGLSEHLKVVGLSGDAPASGAVVGAVVEVVLPDAWN